MIPLWNNNFSKSTIFGCLFVELEQEIGTSDIVLVTLFVEMDSVWLNIRSI